MRFENILSQLDFEILDDINVIASLYKPTHERLSFSAECPRLRMDRFSNVGRDHAVQNQC